MLHYIRTYTFVIIPYILCLYSPYTAIRGKTIFKRYKHYLYLDSRVTGVVDVPEKTYTVVRYTLFTQEEFRELLRRAHEECKREVPITAHRIGKRNRLMIAHPRQQYLACIRRKIDEAIKARLQSIGATITA